MIASRRYGTFHMMKAMRIMTEATMMVFTSVH
jgi:hypothetical protein